MGIPRYSVAMTRILLALAAIATVHAQPSGRTGTVTFLVIDEQGHSVLNWKVTRFDTQGFDAISRFDGLSARAVPIGSLYHYVVVLDGPRQVSISGDVFINAPERLIVLKTTRSEIAGFSVDRFLPRDFVIIGKLDPVPAAPARVHLHSIFGHAGSIDLDIPVDAQGTFRIFRSLSGPYTLTVISDVTVIHSQAVVFDDTPKPAPFTLKLAAQLPVLLHVN
jgi:hypothetical protein